ncbi:MAG TPA: hypothetical protein GXZ89_08805 [Fastidiosipila sp.]|nr:hypothetical protein [Fastidiosipila sp.]
MKKARRFLLVLSILLVSSVGSVPVLSLTRTVSTTESSTYTPRGTTGDEELDQIADSILSRLITDSMTDEEIIEKVYEWAKAQITYSSPASSVFVDGAKFGLLYRRGNCYTRAFTQVALLQRAGIDATYDVEYGGRHAWALVGNFVLDTGFRVFWVDVATLQDYVHKGFYLYRTEASDPPESSYEIRTVYDDYKTIPFQTIYELNPDPDSLYADKQVKVEGVNGETRDQWSYSFIDNERYPEDDLLVEDDQVVTAVIDRVVLVGQRWSKRQVIPAKAGEETIDTNDRALHGRRVPGTGLNGVKKLSGQVVEIDPLTGRILDKTVDQVQVIREATPFKTYRYRQP